MKRDDRGFTLIELLIVVVIIGILAAIAIPKFASTREKAYVATMKTDLRNLATAQENYFGDNIAYAPSIAAANAYTSQGVTITVTEATGSGWSATASHQNTGVTCAMYVGSASAVAPATQEGEVRCS